MKYITITLIIIMLSPVFASSEDKNNSYETKAREALKGIVKKQVEKIRQSANSSNSSNENNIKGYVLSTHIRTFSDIPKNIDAQIEQYREQIRLLIRHVATDIEITGGTSGTLSLDSDGQILYTKNKNLPKNLNDKRESLLKANVENNVSVKSAAMAIRILSGINEHLKKQAFEAKTREQKEKIYMMQAIYVYEMADITIELLSGLSLEGKEIIDKLHQDAKERVKKRVSDIDIQLSKAEQLNKDGLLSSEQVLKEEETYTFMRKANEQTLDAWKELISTVGKQQDFLDNLKSKISLIEYKRDKAKVQLETLRDLRQFAELKDTIGNLDNIVASVASLDLLILDEITVRSLLGYNIDN